MSTTVNVLDLAFAAEWLRAYEGEQGITVEENPDQDEQTQALARVAAWLDAEVTRRKDKVVSRAVAKRVGLKPTDPRVKDVVRRGREVAR